MTSAYLGDNPIIGLVAGGASPAPWQRPADWAALPTLATGEQKFVGLFQVGDYVGNFVSLSVTVSGGGTYTVDWGDGVVESGLTSGVKQDHEYDYADADLGAAKSDGNKHALVTVTVQGGNMTAFSLQQKHSVTGLQNNPVVPWLDIAINGPFLTTLAIGGATTANLAQLAQARIGEHAVTTFAGLFSNCHSLVQCYVNVTDSVTSMASMFLNCYALQNFAPMTGTVAGVTTMATMFSGCASLITIPAFPGTVAAVTSMVSMFSGCTSLQTIPAFPGTVAAVTSMLSMFNGCRSLRSIAAFPGTVAAVTTMANMFDSCSSLVSIPAFPGTVAAVTTMASMFVGCSSLVTIPAFPGTVAAVTTMASMFNGCTSLQSIPAFPGSTAAVTTMVSMFEGCDSLKTIPAFPTSVAALASCSRMFENCDVLETIPAFPSATSALTNISRMFSLCQSLKTIPVFSVSAATATTGFTSSFGSCRSLAKGRLDGGRFAINYTGCMLGTAAINDIFTGLGTASGAQAITVSGNPGFATCDQTIATAKGWTVN
jgi:hypothetical protein